MTKTLPKLVLSSSRDIPFCQLELSQSNVRRFWAVSGHSGFSTKSTIAAVICHFT